MDAIKNNEERTKKQARELAVENEKCLAELKVARKSTFELGHQLTNYEKNKQCLAVSTKQNS